MKLLSILVFVLFFHCSLATTYYINPKGNDKTGNGSINKPWQTLHKATSTVITAGDIIHVMAGIYIETQQIVLAIGVSIEGEGVTSIIKSKLTADWTALLIAKSDTEGTDGNQHISNLKFDGQNLSTFWAIYVAGRSNVSIHNCTIVDFKNRGVIFAGRTDNLNAAPAIYAKRNKFYNNTMDNCADYIPGNYGAGALNIGGQEGMLIYNNTITQNSRPEGYNGWPIKYENDGYLKGIKIYNNILTKIPSTSNYGGEKGWDFAIELWNVIGGMEIYGNIIQGSVDLVNSSKQGYEYSVWFHNNTVSQKKLNSHYESGVIFEASTEAVIVENNIFDKIAGGILFNTQEGTVLSDIIIRKNIFSNIGRDKGNGNNGSAINLNCGDLFGNTIRYSVYNFLIYDNSIIAAANNAPYYGIEITGAAYVTNLKIQNNHIKDFRVAWIIANPANVIDSLIIEHNILTGNGNNNNPFYIRGTPVNYTFKKNIKNKSSPGLNPGFNFKQQIVRPIYYEVKNFSMLEYIAFFSFFIFFWFSSKENIYVYPTGLICTSIYLFLSFEGSLWGRILMNIYFMSICIYGWINWSKRDHRKHRIVRITGSARKEWKAILAYFASCYIIIFAAMSYFKKGFSYEIIQLADAFIIASAFTGMWLMTKKKVESWYWWIAANIASIPLFYVKHYVFTSAFNCVLLVIALFGLCEWKKRVILNVKFQETNKTKT